MGNRLLLISQVFYPDEVSTANLFTNLCSVLVEEGVDVEVWCAQPSYTSSKRQTKRLVHNGVNISILPSTHFRKSFLFGRLVNYTTFMLSVLWKLFFTNDKKPVVTHTTPPSLGIVLSLACSLKDRKFIYVLLDIFPEGLIRLGKLSRNNLLIRGWEYMFRLSLKKSDRLVVIGRDMEKWIRQITDKCDNLAYIPLWQDDKLISPAESSVNDLCSEFGLNDRFVIQYSGNMGLWNDMYTIGRAVRSNPDQVTFMFIGNGMRKKELLDSFNNKVPENVIMMPFQANADFRKTVTACHAALVSLGKGLEGMAVPSKIYGIMAAGIPVIAIVPFESEIAMIVKEENCGIVVEPGDAEGIINAILQLKSDEEKRKIMGAKGRKAFEDKYTTKVIAFKYKKMLAEIID
jgi:glycosyltransferase involved in cell wall biosynthesis